MNWKSVIRNTIQAMITQKANHASGKIDLEVTLEFNWFTMEEESGRENFVKEG